jgi:hypothetical protein
LPFSVKSNSDRVQNDPCLFAVFGFHGAILNAAVDCWSLALLISAWLLRAGADYEQSVKEGPLCDFRRPSGSRSFECKILLFRKEPEQNVVIDATIVVRAMMRRGTPVTSFILPPAGEG